MKTVWGVEGISFQLKGKKKPTGEGNKANQLPLLRTSSKTGDKFSGYSTIKSCSLKEIRMEGKDSICLGLFPVLKGKNSVSKVYSLLPGVVWLRFF